MIELWIVHEPVSPDFRLQSKFKVELIIRTTNNFRLSNAGKLLYEKFINHKVYLDESISELRNSFGLGIKGTLRVALPVLLSKNIIAPYLGNFLEEHSEIDLLLSYRSSYIDVIQDGFDLAVTLYAPASKNFRITTLKKFRVQLYATPQYLEQFGPIETLADAVSRSSVGFLGGDGGYSSDFLAVNIISGEITKGTIPHPRIYIDNLINAYELASSHKMMITAWDYLVADELRSGKLVKILPEFYFREISCYLVLPSQAPTKSQQVFADFIQECFGRIA